MIEIVNGTLDEIAAYKLIIQARQQSEPFDYEPSPPPDGVKRVKRPITIDRNGSKYHGEWDELGRKDGKGIRIWPDGSLYEGYWKADLKHGRGRFLWPDGDIYSGEFFEGNIDGDGEYTWSDGRKFDGQWKTWILSYCDGKIMKGEWVNDNITRQIEESEP